jgi:glutathione S-transferase
VNPRRVVPTLVLEDGTAIGEVPAIMRYLDEAYPAKPLLGRTPKEKALSFMWERRMELEGFAAVMEGIRNKAAGLKGRAIAGPHDYEQIPALVERSELRVKNFLADLNDRLAEVPFVAGTHYSAADITALVTVDFAANALTVVRVPEQVPLDRWYKAVEPTPLELAPNGLPEMLSRRPLGGDVSPDFGEIALGRVGQSEDERQDPCRCRI